MTYRIHTIANWFTEQLTASEASALDNHLKLQKMLYFSQAWTLALEGEELFNENFEAWSRGPLAVEVFNSFRDEKTEMTQEVLSPNTLEILEQVSALYGQYPLSILEVMSQNGPWQTARKSCEPEEICHTIISKEEIQQYFQAQYLNS